MYYAVLHCANIYTYRGQLIHECAFISFMTMVTNITKILSIASDLVQCLSCRDDLYSKAPLQIPAVIKQRFNYR